ncbi:MAG TPA: ester cyclase [Anaerolineae bacterium]
MAANEVTTLAGVDISKLMEPGAERRQPLEGFDEDYVDIVDYIVRCTHKIWQQKQMGLIYSHYAHNCPVWTSDGLRVGREDVISGSIQALYMSPDRRGYADEVVWTGNDQDGFYTSHLNTSVGHCTGHSVYGPPTGKAFTRRGIALCNIKANRIVEEWLLRDDLATIRTMGFDVEETIAKLARRDVGNPKASEVYGDIERVFSETTPEAFPPKQSEAGAGFDVDDLVRRTLHELWNWRMFDEIRQKYAPNHLCHTVDGRELYGRADYRALVLGLIASFPDAHFLIDQLFWMGDDEHGYRTSMRWSILGTNEGYGFYGDPTGARCRLWGITQHVIRSGKFVEEYTYWNDLAIRKRLYLARNGLLKVG